MIRVDVTHWPKGKDERLSKPAHAAGVIEFEGISISQPDGSTRVPMKGGQIVPRKVTLHPRSGRPEGELSRIAELIEPRIAGNVVKGYVSDDSDGNGTYEWVK
jgi:hypothetical protein